MWLNGSGCFIRFEQIICINASSKIVQRVFIPYTIWHVHDCNYSYRNLTSAISFPTLANVLHRNKAIVQNAIEYMTLTKNMNIILSVRIGVIAKHRIFIIFPAGGSSKVSSTCTASWRIVNNEQHSLVSTLHGVFINLRLWELQIAIILNAFYWSMHTDSYTDWSHWTTGYNQV